MYKIPSNTDLSFLVGAEIVSITIYQFHVIFTFNSEGTISVESSFEIVESGNRFIWSQEDTNVNLPTRNLFGSKVAKYVVEDETTLVLLLENNLSIRFLDTSEQYESFQISNRTGDHYIV